MKWSSFDRGPLTASPDRITVAASPKRMSMTDPFKSLPGLVQKALLDLVFGSSPCSDGGCAIGNNFQQVEALPIMYGEIVLTGKESKYRQDGMERKKEEKIIYCTQIGKSHVNPP